MPTLEIFLAPVNKRWEETISEMSTKSTIASVVGVILIGTSPAGHASNLIESAKSAIVGRLRDPASVQFKDVRLSKPYVDSKDKKTHRDVCGLFNSKNGFGGYAGFRPFVYQESGLLLPDRDTAIDNELAAAAYSMHCQ